MRVSVRGVAVWHAWANKLGAACATFTIRESKRKWRLNECPVNALGFFEGLSLVLWPCLLFFFFLDWLLRLLPGGLLIYDKHVFFFALFSLLKCPKAMVVFGRLCTSMSTRRCFWSTLPSSAPYFTLSTAEKNVDIFSILSLKKIYLFFSIGSRYFSDIVRDRIPNTTILRYSIPIVYRIYDSW